jgi:hypothetical protein
MNRRRFLKLIGLASLGGLIRVPLSAGLALGAAKSVSSGGRLYRTDGRGRIFVSLDRGASWQLHTYLGPDYAVRRLAADRRDRLHATVGYLGRAFELVLASNQRAWLTV